MTSIAGSVPSGPASPTADLSADGFAERAQIDRSTLAALHVTEVPGPRERVARAAMAERLGLAAECYGAGDTTSQLNVIESWVQHVREIFDLMPADGEQAAVNIARRMAAVPLTYQQLSQTLLGASGGLVTQAWAEARGCGWSSR